MSNISITARCNRQCPYCFTGFTKHGENRDMDRDMFLRALPYLTRSGIDQARLIGGEPTLHPDFIWMAGKALESGFRLMVFSNGLMPPSFLSRNHSG